MTLEVKIFCKNLDLEEQLNDQVVQKVSGLDRYLDDIAEARVDLVSTNARKIEERIAAQITVQGKGFLLRAEERSADVLSALNLAVDTLQRRIKRYKGKRNKRWKKGKGQDLIEEVEEDLLDEPVIARRKKFSLRPMDELEAIEQMELLGHNDFFVFYNAQTEAINVLYRRYDGSYGLIHPEVG